MPEYSMKYSFRCDSDLGDAFTVLSFTGREAISEGYEFTIMAACPANVDFDGMVGRTASFVMSDGEAVVPYHGIVLALDHLKFVHEFSILKIRLGTLFSLLQYSMNSQVFLGKTLPEVLEGAMKQRHLLNYTFELQHEYPQLEYVCQFNETYLDFISRWMENRGLYSFYRQGETQEELVITDTQASARACVEAPLAYAQTPHLAEQERRRAVTSWSSSRSLTPGSVTLRSYNYLTPQLDLSAGKEVAPSDQAVHAAAYAGEVSRYGGYFESVTEAKALAAIRAEELACREKVFFGRSFCPGLRSGHTFALTGHYQAACNAQYLIVEVEHQGHQAGNLPSDLSRVSSLMEDRPDYQATLTAIPAAVQFRPRRTRTKPPVRGMINAVVEADEGSKYPLLDNLGRYKVRLPFDLSDSPSAKASCWLRKAEPYAGSGHGMHFPLLPGTEVLLSFLNGDIDRPFIAAAVHHAQAVSQVTDQNSAANVIRTASNNSLVMGDRDGQEFISLHSPFHDSTIAIGSSVRGGGGSISLKTQGGYESFTVGDSVSATIGANSAFVGGLKNTVTVGASNSITAGTNTAASFAPHDISFYKGNKITLGTGAYTLKDTSKLAGLKETVITGGYQQAAGELISKARTALFLGMAGAVAAAAGAEMESDAFDGGALSDQGGPFYKNKYFYGGAGLLAAGVTACALAQKTVVALIDAFDLASGSTACAMLKLSKDGANLSVDSLIGPTSSLKLTHGPQSFGIPTPAILLSQIVLGDSGSSITLNNQQGAKLTMTKGSDITLSILDTYAKLNMTMSGVTAQSTASVKMEVPAGGSVSAAPTGVTAQMTGGCKLSLLAAEGSLTDVSGANGFRTTPDSAAMACGSVAVDVTAAQITLIGPAVNINAEGMVKIL